MIRKLGLGIGAAAAAVLAATTASAAVVDVVRLRTDCSGEVLCTQPGLSATTCCVQTLSGLADWLWTATPARDPSAAAPVLVDIGPGEFVGPLTCPDESPRNGHVTFRGSGRDTTRILAGSGLGVFAFWILNCEGLAFEDLTIAGAGFGISWRGGGSSQWTNVEVDMSPTPNQGFAIGWNDETPSPIHQKAVHHWFNSSIRASGAKTNIAFNARFSDNWFYGGEIDSDLSGLTVTPTSVAAVKLDGTATLRVFGAAVRSRSGSFCGATSLFGVQAVANSIFRMHGGLISTNAVPTVSCAANIHATALSVGSASTPGPAKAYAPGTAFAVKANGGGGVATRLQIADQGTAEAPFLWPAGTQPPAMVSLKGADLFVETDCAGGTPPAATSCNGAGSETHLMVHNPSCSSKWFDATQGACRPLP